jgi:hypothetical protein
MMYVHLRKPVRVFSCSGTPTTPLPGEKEDVVLVCSVSEAAVLLRCHEESVCDVEGKNDAARLRREVVTNRLPVPDIPFRAIPDPLV